MRKFSVCFTPRSLCVVGLVLILGILLLTSLSMAQQVEDVDEDEEIDSEVLTTEEEAIDEEADMEELTTDGVRPISAQPTLAAEATYFDDFSRYTPGLPPTGWLLRGAADQVTPPVKNVGGAGRSYRMVDFPEVPWQYWDIWLLKDGLT